jgi:hypothetical protein
MARVMMTCPYDGKEIDTGLDLPRDDALTKYAKRTATCSHCHRISPLRLLYFHGAGPMEIHRYHVPLDSHRDFAAEIGIFISCFALVEGYLTKLLSDLIGSSEKDAWTIIGRHQAGERIQLLQALATLRPSSDTKRIAIERFAPRLTSATAVRNKYAHSQYASTFGGAIVVSSWLHDSKRKAKNDTETLAKIVGEVTTIKGLLNDLHGYIWRNAMPPPLPDTDPPKTPAPNSHTPASRRVRPKRTAPPPQS